MKDNGRSGCVDIAGYIGWSVVRTRAIVAEMNEIEAIVKFISRFEFLLDSEF